MQSLQKKAEGRYDLPLNKSGGSKFIILLITLMTFLAVLALSASFALNQVAVKWSSGLENKLTIEIPAEAGNLDALKIRAKKALDAFDNIEEIDVLSTEDISSLVSPWLGEDFALDDVPLPALIAIKTKENTDAFMEKLSKDLQEVHPSIRVDAHEEWLGDFLRMIGSLKFTTFFVSILIGVTAATAITGVIRARMSEHKDDVELLHLMGASDEYIAGQFQRYAMRLGLLGGAFGLLAGAFGLLAFSIGMNSGVQNLLPKLSLSPVGVLVLLSLPLIACGLCASVAKITVLRSLARMP